MLQESDIIWLNKLKKDRPDFYERKLKILGIADEDVPYREMVHPSKAVSKAEDDKRLFHMGGKPYYGVPPMGYMPAPAKDSVSIEKKAVKADELYTGDYYLVDGDNHPYEALEGLNDLSKNDMVMIYVTQEGLKDKLYAKYGNKIHVIMVKSGNQAVDNQIRAILGNAVNNNRKYKNFHIVSHDKGYKDIIERYRRKYKLKHDELDLRETIKGNLPGAAGLQRQ